MKFIAIGALLAVAFHGAHAIDVNKMLSLVNAERSKAGKPPLALDQCLVQAAQKHSDLQARAKTMSHQLPGEQDLSPRIDAVCPGRSWRGWAENVAYGQKSEEDCMHSWMTSPGHRANILGDYTHFGAAAGDAGGTKYWTQDFAKGNGQSSGSPSPSPAPSSSPSPSPPSGGNGGDHSTPPSGGHKRSDQDGGQYHTRHYKKHHGHIHRYGHQYGQNGGQNPTGGY